MSGVQGRVPNHGSGSARLPRSINSRAEDAAVLAALGDDIIDLAPALGDFADTAAAAAALDLVIAVDTSVAHLAGALGRPVWMLTPYALDWRWLRDREDSPWYPTVRLFRQTDSREYASVLDRVRSELRGLIFKNWRERRDSNPRPPP